MTPAEHSKGTMHPQHLKLNSSVDKDIESRRVILDKQDGSPREVAGTNREKDKKKLCIKLKPFYWFIICLTVLLPQTTILN